MKRLTVIGFALLVASAILSGAAAAAPKDAPFPAPEVHQIFVAAQTVTATGAMTNFVAPGSTIVFRAYAVDQKSKKVLAANAVKYFYVTIPGQPNVKLKYNATAPGASAQMPWTGTWNVPATMAPGVVGFKVLIQSQAKKRGQFVQFPVTSAQLTVTPSPQAPVGPAPTPATTAFAPSLDVSLYVDTVNGTRPAGAAPRPVGCTQTNTYKRGEQAVFRVWGTDLATAELLTNENVSTAVVQIPGRADLQLSWAAHGTAPNKVFFWANAWDIPKDYPLGEISAKVVLTLDSGKTGTYEQRMTIVP